MSEPLPSRSPRFAASTEAAATIARRQPADERDSSPNLPAEQRALVARLSEEVAALRRALDASHHRIVLLEAEAAEDPVSGLLNERAFGREVERAVTFQARYRTVCAVALVAVDGTAPGGEPHLGSSAHRTTRAIGDAIRSAMRSCDVGARVGKDLFAIVLWNATSDDCAPRLAAIRAAISALDLGEALTLRCVTTRLEAGDTPESVLERTDALLPR